MSVILGSVSKHDVSCTTDDHPSVKKRGKLCLERMHVIHLLWGRPYCRSYSYTRARVGSGFWSPKKVILAGKLNRISCPRIVNPAYPALSLSFLLGGMLFI